MLEYLPQALSSLGIATNILSSFLKLRDFTKHASDIAQLQSHIIQANSLIISAQNEHSSLTAKIQELEQECMRLKDWSAEKEHYSRQQIAHGVFAYIEKKFVGRFGAAHKLCCNCFDKTIKSTLQQGQKQTHMRMTTLVCPNGCPELQFISYIS